MVVVCCLVKGPLRWTAPQKLDTQLSKVQSNVAGLFVFGPG